MSTEGEALSGDGFPGSLQRRPSGSWRWRVSVAGERTSETWDADLTAREAKTKARERYNRALDACELTSIVAADRAQATVYVVQASITGLVKIGTSRDPRRRLRTIQRTCAQPLLVAGCVHGAGVETEAHLHDALQEHRSHGEWFHPAGAVRRLVRALFHELGPGAPGSKMVHPPRNDIELLQGLRAATQREVGRALEMVGSS